MGFVLCILRRWPPQSIPCTFAFMVTIAIFRVQYCPFSPQGILWSLMLVYDSSSEIYFMGFSYITRLKNNFKNDNMCYILYL